MYGAVGLGSAVAAGVDGEWVAYGEQQGEPGLEGLQQRASHLGAGMRFALPCLAL